MGKSKLNEKLVTTHKFDVDCVLDVDNLSEGSIVVEVEELGIVDLKPYLEKFNGEYVKISIQSKEELEVED